MSKRPTKSEIQAHYAEQVKAASNADLFAIVRREIRVQKYIMDVLRPMADAELQARGVALPTFAAFFAL